MQTLRFRDLKVPPHRPHVAITRLKPEQATEPHKHDFFEVFLVLDGTGLHCVNGAEVALRSGHLAVLRPEDAHWYATGRRETLAFLNVAVAASWWKAFHQMMGEAVMDGWERLGDPPGHQLLYSRELMQIRPMLQQLGEAEPEQSLHLATAWLKVIKTFQTPPSLSKPIEPPAWLETWRQELFMLSEHIEEPIGYWQRRSGRSPEHLARSCRTHYGLTPGELVNRARTERAKLLLRTTDQKVITVAFDCGFNNLANFHRHFLRWTGTTPAAWRRASSAAVPMK